jgi:glycerol transport system ATP-binding protein
MNVIMLDEPLTVIDPHLKWRPLVAQGAPPADRHHDGVRGTTRPRAMTADQVVIMHEGTAVQAGTLASLLERPRATFAATSSARRG